MKQKIYFFEPKMKQKIFFESKMKQKKFCEPKIKHKIYKEFWLKNWRIKFSQKNLKT